MPGPFDVKSKMIVGHMLDPNVKATAEQGVPVIVRSTYPLFLEARQHEGNVGRCSLKSRAGR